MSDVIAGSAVAGTGYHYLKVTSPSSRSHGKQVVKLEVAMHVLGRRECVTSPNLTTKTQVRCLQTTSMKAVVSEFQRSDLIKSHQMGQNQLEEHLSGGCWTLAWSPISWYLLIRQDSKMGQNVERNNGCCLGQENGNRGESSNDSYHEALYPWP